ncbi:MULTISPECIES: thiol peroxidase [Anaerolinea]|nr:MULTISPECIES: thiol peroxidase [Anaerolinea]
MKERYGLIQFLGKDTPVIGEDILPGQQAPEFHAVTQNWEYIPVLESTKGKVRIIAAVPSLETSVCDRETRRFNEEAAKLGKDVVIIVISTDLPFTQKRWCGAAGIDQVWVVSDHREVEFGTRYGCLMKEPRILRRAVFVVDRNDKVTHVEYMAALGEEPDYERVLEAAKAAL